MTTKLIAAADKLAKAADVMRLAIDRFLETASGNTDIRAQLEDATEELHVAILDWNDAVAASNPKA